MCFLIAWFITIQVKDRFCTLLSDRVSELERGREGTDGDDETEKASHLMILHYLLWSMNTSILYCRHCTFPCSFNTFLIWNY